MITEVGNDPLRAKRDVNKADSLMTYTQTGMFTKHFFCPVAHRLIYDWLVDLLISRNSVETVSCLRHFVFPKRNFVTEKQPNMN